MHEIDLAGRLSACCGSKLELVADDPAHVACACGRHFPRVARYASLGNLGRVGARPRPGRPPEPPALQGALEELHQREGELAAAKERERKLRLELGAHATGGLSLLEWAARREAVARPRATPEDFCLGVTLNYQRRTGRALRIPNKRSLRAALRARGA